MKVAIIDPHALKLIRVFQITNYLVQRGWTERRPHGPHADWFIRPATRSKTSRILVPNDPQLDDYADHIREAIERIASHEDRSEIAVYRDVVSTDADLIRIRLVAEGTKRGVVPADQGVALYQGARDMMMACACAALSPTAVYSNRKPEQASSYLRDVHFGQTEEGSFVVTVLSFLKPEATAEGALFPQGIALPFERKVVETAARAVNELEAAVRIDPSPGFDPFRSAVAVGVSANLCDAVSRILEGLDPEAELEFRISWSTAQDSRPDLPITTRFYGRDAEVLRSAAERLRDEAPREDFDLIGSVVDLHRGPNDEVGRINVAGFVDGKPRRVQVLLKDADYQTAAKAHTDRELFRCEGRLIKLGRGWELQDASKASLFTQESS